MQLQDVEKLIQYGESETVEFKKSTGQRTTAAKTLCGTLAGVAHGNRLKWFEKGYKRSPKWGL